MMGNPRRDAFEYGVLCALGSAMAVAYGILIAYSQQRLPDGTRRKLPRVNLEESVDLGEALRELQNFVVGGGSDIGGSSNVSSMNDERSKSHEGNDRPPRP